PPRYVNHVHASSVRLRRKDLERNDSLSSPDQGPSSTGLWSWKIGKSAERRRKPLWRRLLRAGRPLQLNGKPPSDASAGGKKRGPATLLERPYTGDLLSSVS